MHAHEHVRNLPADQFGVAEVDGTVVGTVVGTTHLEHDCGSSQGIEWRMWERLPRTRTTDASGSPDGCL
mgnify:CR=1 FL=1